MFNFPDLGPVLTTIGQLLTRMTEALESIAESLAYFVQSDKEGH